MSVDKIDENEAFENIKSSLTIICAAFNQIHKEISVALDNLVKSSAWKQFIDFLNNIPQDIKETEFYANVAALNKKDLKYEDIRWFIDEMEYNNLEEAEAFIKDKEGSDTLVDYICQLVDNNNIGKREKLAVLLAHFEPLLFYSINRSKQKLDKIKQVVDDEAIKNNFGMTTESFGKVIILGIKNIVFSNTGSFSEEIDNRMPFRNNILHNGTYIISDADIECAYEVLIIFAAELILIEEWISANHSIRQESR